jgi:hypothetical protein
MHGGEQLLRDRSFGERQQQRFIERRRGALRLGLELADGFDFVAEEIDGISTMSIWV